MSLTESISLLSERAKDQIDSITTEEACKNAFIMPLLRALDYDVFDPTIVTPEYIADHGIKKGEKVDYAIKIAGKISMIIECKPCGSDLCQANHSQLFRYFAVEDTAKIAILTNGIDYWFYSDLDKENKMDENPFFKFSLKNYNNSDIRELEKFSKDSFDLENILATASDLKYRNLIKSKLQKELSTPSDDFIKLMISDIWSGQIRKNVLDKFRKIVEDSVKDMNREMIRNQLQKAMNDPDMDIEPNVAEPENDNSDDGIVTTDEEIEAFHIVKSIVREVVKAERIVMRDAKSYCAILIDDNNRRPLARLRFNTKNKAVGLFSGKTEDIKSIDTIDNIYEFAEDLKKTAKAYKEA